MKIKYQFVLNILFLNFIAVKIFNGMNINRKNQVNTTLNKVKLIFLITFFQLSSRKNHKIL